MSVPSTSSSGASNKAQSNPVAFFVSDVHLQSSLPRTTQAFLAFLRERATSAQQLYLLGDMFEYWAGDDDLDSPYNRKIADAIREVSDSGVSVFWIGGNRDFLLGKAFADNTGVTLLPDPFVASIAGHRIVLTHGDEQCTEDHGYMAFRAQVRQAEWQRQFLAIPLAQRKAIIEGMRSGSREAQRDKSYEIMDVNAEAIASLYAATDTSIMIHGHTHRPATHDYQDGGTKRVRHVLPDWDCDTASPRGGWLALYEDGSFSRFGFDGTASQE